jgi:hypothetical protein
MTTEQRPQQPAPHGACDRYRITPHNRPRAERRALSMAAPPGKGRPQADLHQPLPRGAAWRGPARSTAGHRWKLWP